MSTIDFKSIFDASITENKDKNFILKAFIEAGADVMVAIREYNKLARDSGIMLTKEQKDAKVDEILSAVDWDADDAYKDAIDDISEALDVAPSTAASRVRVYCSDKGITLPGTRGEQIASKADVINIILENAHLKRSEISAKIVELGYKKATAETILSMLPYMEEYARQSN